MSCKVGNQTNSQDPQAVNSRVFVGNLNTFQCSKTDVERIFQRYGRIAGISMHKGYAFIQFTNPFDARSACLGEDGRVIWGQTLDVNMVAEPKSHQTGRKRQNIAKTGNDWDYYYDSYYAQVGLPAPRLVPPMKRPRIHGPVSNRSAVKAPSPNKLHSNNAISVASVNVTSSSLTDLKTYSTPDILICGNCREHFTDVEQLIEHKKIYCKLRFTCKCHLLTGKGEEPASLLCSQCKDSFSSAWDLMVHLQQAHMLNIYQLSSDPSSGGSSRDQSLAREFKPMNSVGGEGVGNGLSPNGTIMMGDGLLMEDSHCQTDLSSTTSSSSSSSSSTSSIVGSGGGGGGTTTLISPNSHHLHHYPMQVSNNNSHSTHLHNQTHSSYLYLPGNNNTDSSTMTGMEGIISPSSSVMGTGITNQQVISAAVASGTNNIAGGNNNCLTVVDGIMGEMGGQSRNSSAQTIPTSANSILLTDGHGLLQEKNGNQNQQQQSLMNGGNNNKGLLESTTSSCSTTPANHSVSNGPYIIRSPSTAVVSSPSSLLLTGSGRGHVLMTGHAHNHFNNNSNNYNEKLANSSLSAANNPSSCCESAAATSSSSSFPITITTTNNNSQPIEASTQTLTIQESIIPIQSQTQQQQQHQDELEQKTASTTTTTTSILITNNNQSTPVVVTTTTTGAAMETTIPGVGGGIQTNYDDNCSIVSSLKQEEPMHLPFNNEEVASI